jgi:transcriptional regulator with XRE-family HTH domain
MLDFEKMKTLREKLKLSQQQAADLAGLTGRQQWNDIESGRRATITLATLDKIAAALGCKAKDLLK